MRRLRFVIQPRWLALHAVTVALVVTMVLLGRWQLTVSEDKGFSLQNFGYALQWWAFSVFVVGMWGRSMRDAYRKVAGIDAVGSAGSATGAPLAGPTPTTWSYAGAPRPIGAAAITYRRYVVPTSTPPSDDPVHAAYNDYLAQIAAADLSADDRAILTVLDVVGAGVSSDVSERR